MCEQDVCAIARPVRSSNDGAIFGHCLVPPAGLQSPEIKNRWQDVQFKMGSTARDSSDDEQFADRRQRDIETYISQVLRCRALKTWL